MIKFPTLAFRNVNAPLRQALGVVPGYDDHDRAIAAVQAAIVAARAEQTAAAAARGTLVQTLVATALAPTGTPATLLERSRDQRSDEADATEAVALLDQVETELSSTRDQMLRGSVDAIFADLDDQLREVFTAARALDLGGVTTPEDAIADSKAEQWAALSKACVTVHEIRAAQQQVMSVLVQDVAADAHRETFGAIRNYAELFPRWLDRARGVPAAVFNGDAVTPAPPWPEDDPAATFAWLVAHPEAEVWVPSPQQIHTVYAQAHAEASYTQLTPEEQKAARIRQSRADEQLRRARSVNLSGSYR